MTIDDLIVVIGNLTCYDFIDTPLDLYLIYADYNYLNMTNSHSFAYYFDMFYDSSVRGINFG